MNEIQNEAVKLKNKIINNEIEEQEIKYEDAYNAYLASLITIKDKYDAFYYFASMNLLNAYVKKSYAVGEFKKKYKFKNYIVKGLEQIILSNIEDVNIYLDTEIAYINVLNFQFSFHNIVYSKFLLKYIKSNRNKKQEWEGIKLQPYAMSIYNLAKNIYYMKNKDQNFIRKT